uniref:Uncharacterized protein n=1 Tax=Anguilla anguilla TaxID=7936 RepID=A0A0E9RYC7_ANGAN
MLLISANLQGFMLLHLVITTRCCLNGCLIVDPNL